MSAAPKLRETPRPTRRPRRITLDVIAHHVTPTERCVTLRAGGGELIARFDHATNALALTAADRASGAAFVDAIARWLGMPLAAAARSGERIAASVLSGTFACSCASELSGEQVPLGCEDHVLELFVADTEALLYLDSALARAALAEKWATRRATLLRALDRAIGLGRALEERAPIVLADHGEIVARASVPRGWIVERDHARATDPSGRVVLALHHELPIADADTITLEPGSSSFSGPPTPVKDRGDLAYMAFDRIGERGTRRTLVAATDRREVIATYDFKADTARWALAEWERILSTLAIV